MKAEKLIETIVQSIVQYPDDVKIERTVDNQGILLTVAVNDEDKGVVVGKQGSVAIALRTILARLAYKNEERIALKFAFDNQK